MTANEYGIWGWSIRLVKLGSDEYDYTKTN